jgi:short subunit dehydrogenase-like uncharacterized protein
MQAFSLVGAGLAKLPGVRSGMRAVAGRVVKGSTGGPSPEERSRSGSHIVAIAYNGSGGPLAEVSVAGVNGYEFTGRILAWGASRALAQEVRGTGALGPVEAFGLAELEAGCAEAGISRVETA